MPSFTTYISFPSQHKALAHSKKNQTKKSNKRMICDDIMCFQVAYAFAKVMLFNCGWLYYRRKASIDIGW